MRRSASKRDQDKRNADQRQNTYLIDINVTNKQKEKYYHEYVPELLDVSFSCALERLDFTHTARRVFKTYLSRVLQSSIPSGREPPT